MRKTTLSRALFVPLLFSFLTAGCSKPVDDISRCKGGYLPSQKAVTVGEAFRYYRYFTVTKWDVVKTAAGQSAVEFTGDLDMQCPASSYVDEMIVIREIAPENTTDSKYVKYSKVRVVVQFTKLSDSSFKISNVARYGTAQDGSTTCDHEDPSLFASYIYNKKCFPSEYFVRTIPAH